MTRPVLRQTALDTPDVRALAEFYRRLLGFAHRPGDEASAAGEPDDPDWLVLVGGGTRLAFQQVAALPRPTWPDGPRPQMLHLDMTVPDVSAGRAARPRARPRRDTAAGPVRRPGGAASRVRRPGRPPVLPLRGVTDPHDTRRATRGISTVAYPVTVWNRDGPTAPPPDGTATMPASSWTATVLAVACLAVAAVFGVIAGRGGSDRAAAAAHALMGLGMAAMLAPWSDPTPPLLGAAVFGAVAAGFGTRAVRGSAVGPGGPAHLVVAPAAMAMMYLTGGHMNGMDGMAGSGSAVVAALFLGLTGYFAWHAWTCAGRIRLAGPGACAATGPVAAGSTTALAVRGVRVEPLAHTVMSGLMAAMFLLAV